MTTKQFASLTLAAAAAMAWAPAAMAQSDRAEIKAETRAANKNGSLPRGESTNTQGKLATTKTRADRKGETKALAKDGKLNERGETGSLDGIVETPKSSADRPAVKAETRAAVRSGQIPSGEIGTAK